MVKCNNCKNLETKDNGFDAYSWCEKINDCPHEDIERDCEHYVPMINADRFVDFFQRCIADMGTCCGNFELETAVMMEKAFTESKIYDQNKIVEQLEDYGNEEMCYYKNTPYEKCIEECINKAIEIVKAGGADA